ncbi:class I SAM-dependent methyltransferase [Flavobacterium sp. MAH-1]|uniref:Class I SAM-dependent methyltransferase n=1 Tax=Flavobacterium agri TaxID=2743471 RepID=A0A7Y8Y017_9FLAO|nr:class I SAM-dependent methyltransferase [Flavobacterium agri]NUY79988.1 class I SAM-dependent methyltransferase [Flavobacterium agri]NYA70013.1 class I SAM-dependent methyltransferase [Flavobacterium agri]
MNRDLLRDDVQKWIADHTFSDVKKLALAKNPFPDADYKELLNQISARAKAKDKLPGWFNTGGIVYPSKISVEQTSSEKTAEYKSHLVSGEKLIDLTGGFGVDDFYFSKQVNQVVHCEMNPELSEIAAHNFKRLERHNIVCESGDSTEILKNLETRFDWIYIDPSRRNDTKGKVFLLADCLPNVPELLDFYFSFSDNILIKTAPLLDITAGLKELSHVSAIHIVAVENEVKELLFEVRKDFIGSLQIKSVNLLKNSTQEFSFLISEMYVESEFGTPKKYLYEPNTAIYKSGAFDLIGRRFGLTKLHKHSHLYTSETLVHDFPGRIFEIQTVLDYDKNAMKTHLQGKKTNVSVRNFPETVEKLRQKWKMLDGGDSYSFFTTAYPNDKIVLLCAKI